jgi:hypothetical protein
VFPTPFISGLEVLRSSSLIEAEQFEDNSRANELLCSFQVLLSRGMLLLT